MSTGCDAGIPHIDNGHIFSGSPLTYLFTLCHPLVHGSKEAGEVWKYM